MGSVKFKTGFNLTPVSLHLSDYSTILINDLYELFCNFCMLAPCYSQTKHASLELVTTSNHLGNFLKTWEYLSHFDNGFCTLAPCYPQTKHACLELVTTSNHLGNFLKTCKYLSHFDNWTLMLFQLYYLCLVGHLN